MAVTLKRFAALAVLVAALGPAPMYAADPPDVVLPLTQFEVLGLAQQGLGDEAIIAKLRETRSTFRLSTNDVQMLKTLGVSSRVLAAMAGDAPRPLPPVVQAAATTPTLPRTPPPSPGPVGTWYRQVGPMLFVLKVGPDHLTATITQSASMGPATGATGMTFSADYVPTKDGGTLHGLITGADVVVEGDLPDAGAGSGAGEMFGQLGAMADQPFALSFRVRDGELVVRNVRVAVPADSDLREPFAMLAGRYKSAGDKPIPKPRPMPQTHTGGMTLPSPQYLTPPPPVQYIPSQFPQAPALMPQPIPLPTMGGGPLLPTAYNVPSPVATTPMMVPPPPPPPTPTGSKLTGTWVREFDGMQVVLKLTDKRLFATLNVAYVVDGTKDEVRMTFRSDADYSVGPDGTLFGVVTGTDFTPPKGGESDLCGGLKMLTELSGMPFCFRFRIDEGVLNVRDLRTDVPGEGASSVAVLGRYTRTEKEPAPPKAVKMPNGCDGPRCRPSSVTFSADPNVRMDQLINQSEDIRQIIEPAPAPRPVPVERLHGGIIK